jgi:hypothetical protein
MSDVKPPKVLYIDLGFPTMHEDGDLLCYSAYPDRASESTTYYSASHVEKMIRLTVLEKEAEISYSEIGFRNGNYEWQIAQLKKEIEG